MRTDLCVRAVHKGEMRVDVRVREHVFLLARVTYNFA